MTVVSASWELQKAVVARAIADSDVQKYLGASKTRLLDFIPKDVTYPFAFIGDGDESNIGPGCDDEETSFRTGHTVAITVVTSDESGYTACKPIAAAIVKALHGITLSISGYDDASLFYKTVVYRRNPDVSAQRQATIIFETELSPSS